MNLSVLKELKEFENGQESSLEEKKKQFLESLNKKKDDIEDNLEMELYEITSNKHNRVKKAQKDAKEEAVSSINSFKEKTKKIKESSVRIEQATDLIFSEFLNQNV